MVEELLDRPAGNDFEYGSQGRFHDAARHAERRDDASQRQGPARTRGAAACAAAPPALEGVLALRRDGLALALRNFGTLLRLHAANVDGDRGVDTGYGLAGEDGQDGGETPPLRAPSDESGGRWSSGRSELVFFFFSLETGDKEEADAWMGISVGLGLGACRKAAAPPPACPTP